MQTRYSNQVCHQEQDNQGTRQPGMPRVGYNRIFTPYMTVYLVISLPKIPYIHRIFLYIRFWPTLYIYTVCDRIFGDFPAKNTVYTPYIIIYKVLANSRCATRCCEYTLVTQGVLDGFQVQGSSAATEYSQKGQTHKLAPFITAGCYGATGGPCCANLCCHLSGRISTMSHIKHLASLQCQLSVWNTTSHSEALSA